MLHAERRSLVEKVWLVLCEGMSRSRTVCTAVFTRKALCCVTCVRLYTLHYCLWQEAVFKGHTDSLKQGKSPSGIPLIPEPLRGEEVKGGGGKNE